MSIKLGLHFICKDEAHCITKMLESCVNVADVIVANDTGSTDGTQDIIRDFGKKHNIPTFVVERPFDTFEKSRNYAMDTFTSPNQPSGRDRRAKLPHPRQGAAWEFGPKQL